MQDRPVRPILTAHLFPKLDAMLLELLRSLTSEDWEKQTVSPKWKVKDVAAHLLDTPLRGVSIARDGYLPEAPRIGSGVELAAYIDRLNEEGVSLYRRLNPAVLISLMQVASQLLAEYHRSRDPDASAPYGVSWAGEGKIRKLVRHGPGIHGTLAPPAADPASGEQAGHHDPRTLPSRFGLLLAGPAVPLSHRFCEARNLRSDQRFR